MTQLTRKVAIAIILLGCFSSTLAQTQIYRSFQHLKTSAIKAGTGINLTISGSTATFGSAMPDTIGVGDAIQYDATGLSAITNICFIHGRTSSTVYTVKTAAGGTPTAVTNDQDWSIFRAYTSLTEWEAGTENAGISVVVRNFDAGNRNLVSNNEQWHVAIYKGTNTEISFFIAGWTTLDSTGNYVRFFSPYATSEVGVTQRHNGTATTPYPRINSFTLINSAGGADINQAFRFEGLVSIMDATNCANFQVNDATAASRIYFDSMVIFGRDGSGCSGTTAGITVASDFFGKLYFKNCIFYNFDGSGANSGAGSHAAIDYTNQASTGSVYVNNITDYGSNYTIKHQEPSGTVIVKNSITQNGDNTVGFFTAGGAAYHADSDYNLSDEASPDAPGTNSKRSTTVTFINAAGNNFHLNATDIAAGNSGTDLSGDSNLPVTTDIDSDARPTSAYVDIGADEGVASPASTNRRCRCITISGAR